MLTVYCEQATWSTLCRYMDKQSRNSAKYSARVRGLMRVRNALPMQLSRLPFLIALCKVEWQAAIALMQMHTQ